MAHYAFLDASNTVTEVITGLDEGDDTIDWEEHYGKFRGQPCKRTSYNTYKGTHRLGGIPFRKNYAGIGYTYDPDRDAFIPPKPFASWVLDEGTCTWGAPIPIPSDDLPWQWDEATGKWTLPPAPPSSELTDPELKALSDQIAQALA